MALTGAHKAGDPGHVTDENERDTLINVHTATIAGIQAGIGAASDVAVSALVANPASATHTSLDAAYVPVLGLSLVGIDTDGRAFFAPAGSGAAVPQAATAADLAALAATVTAMVANRVGSAENPITDPAAARPTGIPSVHWMTATMPVNFVPGDVAHSPTSSSDWGLTPPSGNTVSSPPRNILASAGDTVASVQWDAPTQDGGTPVTAYTVTASPGGRSNTGLGAGVGTVTGLTNGTTYTFTVTATNAIGISAVSAMSNSVTPASVGVATVPGAPAGVTAVAGNGVFTANWVAPVNNGGSPITGYRVTVQPSGSIAAITTSLSQVITNATNGTAWTFTVQAINAIGSSPASAVSNSVTPSAPSGGAGGTGVLNYQNGWGGWSTELYRTAQLQLVTSPVRAGFPHSAQFTIAPGDFTSGDTGRERGEVAAYSLADSGNVSASGGTTLWYGWSSFFPTGFQNIDDGAGAWEIFTQWHSWGNGLSPVVALLLPRGPNPAVLINSAGTGGTEADYYTSTPIPLNQWVDYRIQIKFAPNNQGTVLLKQNGVTIANLTSITTQYSGEQVYAKQGLYRSARSGTQTLYHTGFCVGTTEASVTL